MNKKSFLLYTDSYPLFEALSDEEAGKIIKSIFRYVENGDELETDSRVLSMTFAVFKAQIDRGQEKYESICKKRTEAINKRWERYKSIQMNTNEYDCIQVNTNDTNRSNSDSNSDIKEKLSKESKKKDFCISATDVAPSAKINVRKMDFYNSLVPYVDKYGKEMVRDFYDYWTEPNRSRTKMRFELERTFEVSRRLSTWAAREKNIVNNGNSRTSNQAAQRTAAAARDIKDFILDTD